jgi:hypothetical protein
MSAIATERWCSIDQPLTQEVSGKRWPFHIGLIASSSA